MKGSESARPDCDIHPTLWVDSQYKIAGWMKVDMADTKNPTI